MSEKQPTQGDRLGAFQLGMSPREREEYDARMAALGAEKGGSGATLAPVERKPYSANCPKCGELLAVHLCPLAWERDAENPAPGLRLPDAAADLARSIGLMARVGDPPNPAPEALCPACGGKLTWWSGFDIWRCFSGCGRRWKAEEISSPVPAIELPPMEVHSRLTPGMDYQPPMDEFLDSDNTVGTIEDEDEEVERLCDRCDRPLPCADHSPSNAGEKQEEHGKKFYRPPVLSGPVSRALVDLLHPPHQVDPTNPSNATLIEMIGFAASGRCMACGFPLRGIRQDLKPAPSGCVQGFCCFRPAEQDPEYTRWWMRTQVLTLARVLTTGGVGLPSAADLDAVAEEKKAAEATAGGDA